MRCSTRAERIDRDYRRKKYYENKIKRQKNNKERISNERDNDSKQNK